MKKTSFLFAFIYQLMMVSAQQTIPLYSGEIPNSKKTKNEEYTETNKEGIMNIHKISQPALTIFLPPKEKANGIAVVICPGGGYWTVAARHEGYDVAKRFNEAGIAAFVLKYRLPDTTTMTDKETGPLQDAQRAIQIVRENAEQWGIDKNRVGIMGFSAGGHLASTAGTHFKKAYINNTDHTRLRPDFMVLVYPVISFTDSIGHRGSRDQLIGKKPSSAKIKEYSNELQVSKKTPPAFLVHAKDDEGVNVKNSLQFAAALTRKKIKNEVYLYEKGGHGFGMNNSTSNVKWMDLIIEWIKNLK